MGAAAVKPKVVVPLRYYGEFGLMKNANSDVNFMDIVTGGPCTSCRFGEKEEAWIEQFMTKHPEFDQAAMDAQVALEMQQLVDDLNRRKRYRGKAVFTYEQRVDKVEITEYDNYTQRNKAPETNYFTRYLIKIWDPRYVPTITPTATKSASAPPAAVVIEEAEEVEADDVEIEEDDEQEPEESAV